MQFRTGWIAALCAVGMMGRAESVSAQEVRFAGYTNGCFSPVGGPECVPTFGPGFQPGVSTGGVGNNVLTYYNSVFDDFTVSGFLALGGGPVGGPGNVNNLGAFGLNVGAAGTRTSFTGMGFTLGITFTAPVPVNPTQLGGSPVTISGNRISFAALLRGTVSGTSNGGVNVNFANNAVNFFSVDTDGVLGESVNDFIFSFQLADMNVNPDAQPASVTANLQAIGGVYPQGVVPEPSTYVLMATGLAGVAAAARLRRRA